MEIEPQVWGMNFQRNIRRKREQVYWAPIERIYNLYRLSSAGELHGLELETPRNFKVTPYAVATASRNYLRTRRRPKRILTPTQVWTPSSASPRASTWT